ncbi:MAG: TRAP transporter substrate-binding protein [Pseudomonadota bacterium]
MRRRSFLTHAAAVSGAAALAAPALSQGRQEVRLATTWPRDFPGLGTGAQRVADRITLTSEGRLTVKLFAAGELVPAFDSFDAVANGDAEMYHGADYYWQGKHKGFNFFTSVPLGLTAKELNSWVLFGGGQQLWDQLSGEFGIKPFLAGNTGVQMGGWFRNPVTSLDDIRGLRMRIPGLGGETLRQLGAEPVSLPGGEIFAALQDGRIDATEWVGPYNDLAFGLQKFLKTYMYPGFHEPGTAIALGINKAWWDSLPEADQLLIQACAETENDMMIAEYNANNGASMRELAAEHDVTVTPFPREVWDEIARVGDQVVADVAKGDLLGARIYNSYQRFRRSVAGWSEISDQAYLRARADAFGTG